VTKRWPALAALACLAVVDSQARDSRSPSPFPELPTANLQVLTATGSHRFQVWVAADDRSRERGLMHVRKMAPDQGTLFLFEQPQNAAFWMKNTCLSLDLVFIGADGVFVNFAPDADPLSLRPIESVAPVKAVLELVAGTAAKIELSTGDRVIHPAFEAEKAN
jgi:uncharacterized membrane protein (UPF0127 family)